MKLFLVALIFTAAFAQSSAVEGPILVWAPAVVSSVSAAASIDGFSISANVELPRQEGCCALRIFASKYLSIHYVVLQARDGKIRTEGTIPSSVTQHFVVRSIPKFVRVTAFNEQHKLKEWTVNVKSP